MNHSSEAVMRALLLETLSLLEAAMLYFVFVLPAMIQAAGGQLDVQRQGKYVTASVAPTAPGREPLEIGKHVGLYVRQGNDVTHVFAPGDTPGQAWRVQWAPNSGPHYSLRLQGRPAGDVHIGAWLKTPDPNFPVDVRSTIRVHIYHAADALDIHTALRDGSAVNSAVTIDLNAADGFQAEQLLPASFWENN